MAVVKAEFHQQIEIYHWACNPVHWSYALYSVWVFCLCVWMVCYLLMYVCSFGYSCLKTNLTRSIVFFYFVSLGYGFLKTNLTWNIVWSILWIKIKHARSFLQIEKSLIYFQYGTWVPYTSDLEFEVVDYKT